MSGLSFNCLIRPKTLRALINRPCSLFSVVACAQRSSRHISATLRHWPSYVRCEKTMFARRLLGFDPGDWSILVVGIALAGLLVMRF